MEWAKEVFLKDLEKIRKGDINWELESLELHVELYKDKLGSKVKKQLKEAVKEGVRIQIEKLRKSDGDIYGISRAVKKYNLSEEAMFKDAYKIYYTRSLEDYVIQLEGNRANYNERDWFIKHKDCTNLNLQKRFEKVLEDYRERSGIKEFEEVDEITKRHGIDSWRWDDRENKTLNLEMRLPFHTRFGEVIAKKYGGKIDYEPPYIPEDMSTPLTDGYWYLSIPATINNFEELSKETVKARDEIERMTYKADEKLVKAALEPNQRTLNLY
jgi:hypothetical protein